MPKSIDTFVRVKVTQLAKFIANPYTFVVAVVICAIWIAYGCMRGFPLAWAESTQVVFSFATFIMVFIIQFSEEADTTAQQRKLDAIIEADKKIDQSVVGHEEELKGISEK